MKALIIFLVSILPAMALAKVSDMADKHTDGDTKIQLADASNGPVGPTRPPGIWGPNQHDKIRDLERLLRRGTTFDRDKLMPRPTIEESSSGN